MTTTTTRWQRIDEIRTAGGSPLLERLPDGALSLWLDMPGAKTLADQLRADGYAATEVTDYTARWEPVAGMLREDDAA